MVLQKQLDLQKGDIVQSINGSEISSWADVVEVIRKNPNKKLDFTISRDGKDMEIAVTPLEKKVEGEKIGLIGVYSPVEKSPVQAVKSGFHRDLFLDKANFCYRLEN